MTKRISNRRFHIKKYNQRKYHAYGKPLFETFYKYINAKIIIREHMFKMIARYGRTYD